jgi:hypothetical protein
MKMVIDLMREEVPASETPPGLEKLLVIPVAPTGDPIPEPHELIACEFAHPPEVSGRRDARPLIARTITGTLAALPIPVGMRLRAVDRLRRTVADVPAAECTEPSLGRLWGWRLGLLAF